MGLWNFVKNAGSKLTGHGDESPSAEALHKEVTNLNLDAKDVGSKVDGDKVAVTSKDKTLTQEAREKRIVAVGNVDGVADGYDAVRLTMPQSPFLYRQKR